jgi:DHA1 family bicyclomycin/chloramphenicol resistance-like MFS transporter
MPSENGPSKGEFVALVAMLFATIALSIDAMLPALPDIAASLSPENPNRAQLVVTSFVFGMGLGTLFMGPISDAVGRKMVMLVGGGLFILASLACYLAQSLDMLLLSRVLQGIAAAAPRVVSTAMVRDLYKGRDMAQLMSFVMMVFMVVPALAPLMGQGVMALAGWQAIFLVYTLFAAVTMIWMGWRQPETLPIGNRRPLRLRALTAAIREIFGIRVVIVSIAAQTLSQAALFATLSSMQGIFEQRFDRAESFPLWFALIAFGSALAAILNSQIVMRLGMRLVVVRTYSALVALTALLLAVIAGGLMPEALAFPAHILWSISLFSMMSLTMGNLNAMAMEPVGHIAGMASSVISATSTVVSVLLAVPVGLALNGTAVPLMAGVLVFMALALLVMALGTRRETVLAE